MLNTGTQPETGTETQRKRGFLARGVRFLWRFASDAPYRHMMRLLWRPPAGVFQPFNDTQPDRYPVIFKFVQRQLGADSDVNILSFGCATGEEVFSLRSIFRAPRSRASTRTAAASPSRGAACARLPMPRCRLRMASRRKRSRPRLTMRSSAWPCCGTAV